MSRLNRLWQAFTCRAPVAALLLLFLLGGTLAACGKKAAHVDAPDDVQDDTFPHQKYPDIKTDPAPAEE